MLAREPQLQPLIELFTAGKVWLASEMVLGCPPTWNLSTDDLLKISESLHNEKG